MGMFAQELSIIHIFADSACIFGIDSDLLGKPTESEVYERQNECGDDYEDEWQDECGGWICHNWGLSTSRKEWCGAKICVHIWNIVVLFSHYQLQYLHEVFTK